LATKTYLLTGGAGFIGSALALRIARTRPDVRVVVLDALTYAGHRDNLEGLVDGPTFRFVHGDITDAALVARLFGEEKPTHVLHLAAESHVDRSITSAQPFVTTNVLGTQVLLDAARAAGVEAFLHVSTDEVYGSLSPTDPPFTERTPLDPSSPYSASKAGSDLLALAAAKTHGLHVVVTRCSNNYGPRQLPEKLIPLMTLNALEDKALPVYGDGQQVRDWIHVDDHARGLLLAMDLGKRGEVYNLGGECEKPNLWIVQQILQATGKGSGLIRYVQDRPAHDRRYAMDIAKARADLGFVPEVPFARGLAETVAWYGAHRAWCEKVRGESYRKHQAEWYERPGRQPQG
jgi:dTDP-glucose 4,6-dehydratase